MSRAVPPFVTVSVPYSVTVAPVTVAPHHTSTSPSIGSANMASPPATRTLPPFATSKSASSPDPYASYPTVALPPGTSTT